MLAPRTSAAIVGLLHGCSTALSYPNPEPMKGTIPFNANATIDPALIRRKSDGILFLYTTGPGTNKSHGGEVWTADSLYGPWTHSPKQIIPEWCGAPTLFEKDDLYYMFFAQPFTHWPDLGYTNREATLSSHNRAIFVRNSSTLEAMSWGSQPNGTRLLIDWSADYNKLDLSLTLTREGEYLATWGSYQQGIYQMPLSATLDAVINGTNATNFNMNGHNINHLATNSTSITYPTASSDMIEAPFQFYWNGFYYSFFSSGHAQAVQTGRSFEWSHPGDVYKVIVCRATKATGPFVDANGTSCLENGGTQILGTHDYIWAPGGQGGQGVLDGTEAGGPILYYHYVPRDSTSEPPVGVGYRFGGNKLDFSSGWPSLVAPQ